MQIKRKRLVLAAVAGLLLLAAFVGMTLATSSKSVAANSSLGAFNPALNPTAAVSPLNGSGSIGPGACWPGDSFNNSNGQAEAVKYLSHSASSADINRDQSWLTANSAYYNYTAGDTDVSWTQNKVVLVQLTQAITITDTYCPSGQDSVLQWKLQTLQPGEWVFFLKGHAPGDNAPLVPVRKANCGNFLLPPPAPVTSTPSAPAAPASPSAPYAPSAPPSKCPCGSTPTTSPPTTTPTTGPCTVCTTPAQTNQAVQDNGTAQANGVNIGPTPGAPSTAPSNTTPAPAATTPGTPAPNPTSQGSSTGATDNSGTPSGTLSGGGSTTSGNSPGITDPQGDNGQSGSTTPVTGLPTSPS